MNDPLPGHPLADRAAAATLLARIGVPINPADPSTRPPTTDEMRTGRRRSQFAIDCAAGRISLEDEITAGNVQRLVRHTERVYSAVENPKHLDPGNLSGAESLVDARIRLGRVRDACLHLWPPLEDSIIRDRSFSEIGRTHANASNDNAAAMGRLLVVTALQFARRELKRQAADERALRPANDNHPLPRYRPNEDAIEAALRG